MGSSVDICACLILNHILSLILNHIPSLFLYSLPEDMTPEYQQLISKEISFFRDRAAQKDKAKREREEERRRRIEVFINPIS